MRDNKANLIHVGRYHNAFVAFPFFDSQHIAHSVCFELVYQWANLFDDEFPDALFEAGRTSYFTDLAK